MLASPFTFYRGAALVMASDLAHTPASGIWAQLCGDVHLSNFAVFGSADRRMVFDLNAAMRDFAAMPNLPVWYARVDIEQEIARFGGDSRIARTEQALANANERDHSALAKAAAAGTIESEPGL
jgi:hypothetical protein